MLAASRGANRSTETGCGMARLRERKREQGSVRWPRVVGQPVWMVVGPCREDSAEGGGSKGRQWLRCLCLRKDTDCVLHARTRHQVRSDGQ